MLENSFLFFQHLCLKGQTMVFISKINIRYFSYEISKKSNYRSNYRYRLRHLMRYLKDAKYDPGSSACLKGKNNYSKSDWQALSFDQ